MLLHAWLNKITLFSLCRSAYRQVCLPPQIPPLLPIMCLYMSVCLLSLTPPFSLIHTLCNTQSYKYHYSSYVKNFTLHNYEYNQVL